MSTRMQTSGAVKSTYDISETAKQTPRLGAIPLSQPSTITLSHLVLLVNKLSNLINYLKWS
eukprot:767320-Hanusia_phi.AAC.12